MNAYVTPQTWADWRTRLQKYFPSLDNTALGKLDEGWHEFVCHIARENDLTEAEAAETLAGFFPGIKADGTAQRAP